MSIRSLFSARRPIDRPIEKVIDYYATDEKRLLAEIEEYEVTDNVERCFRKFLDTFGDGVRSGHVTEIGVWVAGFYGSGKSSFTKYLGFSLDRGRLVGGRPFLDLLCERLGSAEIKAGLRTLATQFPAAVVFLDLGSEQLADTSSAPVSTVLYWKVLQWAGYSKEKKLAELELTLEARGLTGHFLQAYREKFADDWEKVHNDPLIGVARAAQVLPSLQLKEFPTPESFRGLRFEEAADLRDRARRIIELVRRKSGKENILFLIDEAGQYVAPSGDRILNLDGLARNLKELGQGKVWIVATGQQTLAEIVEKAAHNSAELNKLRDRFPIPINLDAQDIREITYRRLLTKSPEGEQQLKDEFGRYGQGLLNFTRLTGTTLYRGDADAATFARLYPFLPQHFDLLLELIRTLARSTGGIGLRSAIRVIQDLLVDTSKVLPPEALKIADRQVGVLACADDFYDSLRADIAKVLPHVPRAVDRVATAFPTEPLAVRVAKTIGVLQAIEGFPKTAENIAALLYPKLGAQGLLAEVREVLRSLVAKQECGIIEDPQAGGFLFLSEGVKPLREKRNAYMPTAAEVNTVRSKLIEAIFDPSPSVKIENVKEVKAGVRFGKTPILGEDADIQFRIEAVDSATFAARRTALLSETNSLPELKDTIVWLATFSDELDNLLVDASRSDWVVNTTPEREADRDVAQFLRAERRAAEKSRERARKLIQTALLEGAFVFRGRPTGVTESGQTLEAAARGVLTTAAAEIFPYLRLVPIRPSTDLAYKFLGVERLDRMPRELDPLNLVVTRGGSPRPDINHPALAETLRAFNKKLDESGGGRLQGNALQDFFAVPPYGWSKDATRYLFAALLTAGEIELHTPNGPIKTSGPLAQEALKSTVAFNRIGVSRRDTRPPAEALDRAANRLQNIFGVDVLPLEDHISKAVRANVPGLLEKIGSLPARLRLLGLPGEDRARRLLETCADLLKQDAIGATSLLGGTDSSFPSDAKWARELTDAFSNGGEAEVRAAKDIENDLAELASLFPTGGQGVTSAGDAAAIREALVAENIQEHLPALRGAVRSTLDRVRMRYSEHRIKYTTSLHSILREFEAKPEWSRLETDDREELAKKLTPYGLPEVSVAGREVSDLRLLLARESAINALRTEVAGEIQRRLPPPPTPAVPKEPPTEELVDFADLMIPEVIKTTADLEGWLSSLRAQLNELLKSNRIIRIKKRLE
jgi:hypothetical protein